MLLLLLLHMQSRTSDSDNMRSRTLDPDNLHNINALLKSNIMNWAMIAQTHIVAHQRDVLDLIVHGGRRD